MSSALLQKIRRTIRRHALLPSGSRVLVGLSGGSDSVALTLALRELGEHGGFAVVALAHLNHQIRPTAARDEAFCRDLALQLGLPLRIERAEVTEYARSERRSLEDAARRLRYDFLARAAAAVGADQVAVGHTEDDQAETFLLKLMRGAGSTGLGAVYPRRGEVVRPLLDVSRADLRAYLRSKGQAWMEDETNEELGNPRNRIRHVVLPELDRAAGRSIRPALARAAALIREDAGWLDDLAGERLDRLQTVREGEVELDRAGLCLQPLPIRRRVLRSAIQRVAGGREIGFEHIEAAWAVATGETGGIDLPGCRVELRREKLVLTRERGTGDSP